jgi:hypothetical protein
MVNEQRDDKMNKINLAIIVGGAVIAASLLQYFFGPKQIKIQEREVVRVVEKIVEKRSNDVVTKRIIEEKPDGTKTTTEVVVDKSKIENTREAKIEATKEKTTEKKSLAGRTTIFGGIGLDTSFERTFVGGVQRDLLGPFGVFGMGTATTGGNITGFVGLSLKF